MTQIPRLHTARFGDVPAPVEAYGGTVEKYAGDAVVAVYHGARTHLSLDKDAPHGRPIEQPELGRVIPIREVGGLHHRYIRRAA